MTNFITGLRAGIPAYIMWTIGYWLLPTDYSVFGWAFIVASLLTGIRALFTLMPSGERRQ